jgi:hypothetical protein
MGITALFGFLMMLVFAAIGIGAMVLWVWAIVDCATKEPSEGNDKIIWILVIVFANWIGAILYYAIRRPERIRKYGR